MSKRTRLGKQERKLKRAATTDIVRANLSVPLPGRQPRMANSHTRLEGGYPRFRDPHGASPSKGYARGARDNGSTPAFNANPAKLWS